QGANRICLPPIESPPVLLLQRFGKHKIPVNKIEKTKYRRRIKGSPKSPAGQQSSQRGTQHKTQPERCADQTEILRPVLVGTDVGDIGAGHGKAGSGYTGQHPAYKKEHIIVSQGQDKIIHAEPQQRYQNNGSSSKSVTQVAYQRRKQKLHGCKNRYEITAPSAGFIQWNMLKLNQKFRHHGNDPPPADHIYGQGYKDKPNGSFPGRFHPKNL